MKTAYIRILSVLICLFLYNSAWGQTDKIEDYNSLTKSFKDFFGNIDWDDYEEVKPEKSLSCRGDGIPRLNRARNPYRDMKNRDVIISMIPLIGFVEIVETAVQGDNFDKVKEAKGSLFDTPSFKRDKMIEKLQTANSAEQFIDFFGTKLDQSKVNFTEDEKTRLWLVYKRAKEFLVDDPDRATISEEYTIGDCKYRIFSRAWPTKIESTKVTWQFKTVVRLKCDCKAESSIYKLESLSAEFIAEVTSSWKNYEIKTMRFRKSENMTMEIFSWSCCDGSKSDPVDQDEPGDPAPDNSKPEGSPKNDKDKDCCYEEQASNSIGFFPIVSLGNNLEDSTIGISAEYLHNMGDSFGNNKWFAGAQVTFATSSGQDGELTENFYSGTAIIENRTPILPCVQWVQRVNGEYGKGTLEAFGNTEDFTHFTVGLNTGVNFDLSSNVSITADANIFEIGSQTFTPANGPDIKIDITNFNLPPTKVRFGFRFKF